MGIQGRLSFDVGDSTAIGLKVAYMDFEEDGSDTAEVFQLGGPPRPFWEGLWVASGAQNADLFTAERDWNVWYNCGDALSVPAWGSVDIGSFCPGREQDSTNVTFDVDHEVGPGSIKFIAAYQDYDYEMRFHALDGGLGNFFRAVRAEEFESFSTELRFTSDVGEKFDYIAGLYYEDSDINRRQDSDLNIPPPFPIAQFQREHEPWNQQTETIAVFAQARVHFSDRFTGVFGARWSDESKDFAFERFYTPYGTDSGVVTPDITLREASRSESEFTPSVALQFAVNDNVNIFASYAQGHKTGGFGDRVDSQTSELEYDAEFIDSIEVGMKSSLLDGAMTFNLVYYDMAIEGLQLATQAPGAIAEFAVSNAADSTSRGVEAESTGQSMRTGCWVSTTPLPMRHTTSSSDLRAAHRSL